MAAGTPNMHCNVTHLTEVIKRTATNIFQVEMAATTHDLHFLPFLTLIGGYIVFRSCIRVYVIILWTHF